MFNEYVINRSVLGDCMAGARHTRGMTGIIPGACYTCKKHTHHCQLPWKELYLNLGSIPAKFQL